MQRLIEKYKQLGFNEEHHFKGEYTLLIDPRMNKIRIYESGDVWKSNLHTGKYEKISE